MQDHQAMLLILVEAMMHLEFPTILLVFYLFPSGE
jgi:hypothetical protein